jgi:hypothetical protein
MVPSNRLNLAPSPALGSLRRPGSNWNAPFTGFPCNPPSFSMLQRSPAFGPLPSKDNFKSAFLALPTDRKYYEALDRLTQTLSMGKGGAVSKQMVTLTCSFSSPDDQEDFWKWLEDGQGVKVKWKAGATLTWKLQKQAGWINFDVWVDPNLF